MYVCVVCLYICACMYILTYACMYVCMESMDGRYLNMYILKVVFRSH